MNPAGRQISNTSSFSGMPNVTAKQKHAWVLKQFNEDIFRRNVLTDVELQVGGHVYKLHRSVLICFSPYLKEKMLRADGKPKLNKVTIPKIGVEEFEILLNYMYTGNLSLTCNNFFEVYKAASVLEMREIMEECTQLLNITEDISSYFYSFVASMKLGNQPCLMKSLKLLLHRFEEAVCASEFLELDVNCVAHLLSAQNIGARSEMIIFLAALSWLNYDYDTRGVHAVKVMQCVRFTSMTMDEIIACYHPPFLPQILEVPEIIKLLHKATCYITARFLGRGNSFKNYEHHERNLVFENLPMELWV